MGSDDIFSAGGFKTSPIEGDEAARHRAMFAALEKKWEIVEESADAIKVVKSIPKLVAVIGAVFTLAAGIAAVAKIYGVTP